MSKVERGPEPTPDFKIDGQQVYCERHGWLTLPAAALHRLAKWDALCDERDEALSPSDVWAVLDKLIDQYDDADPEGPNEAAWALMEAKRKIKALLTSDSKASD